MHRESGQREKLPASNQNGFERRPVAWMDFELPFGLTALPSALPADHHRYWIAPGPIGTDQTIQRMRKVVSSTLESMRKGVTRGKRIFGIRKLIGEIIQPCEPKNYYCYAQKLYEHCRDQIKYTFDPVGVELVESPELILLESRIADCDSIVTVLATLYEAIGLPARFVTVKADPLRPDDYSHVFLEVNLPKHGWVAADPTMPDKSFGWRPDPKFKYKNWPASLDPDSDVRDDVLEPQSVSAQGVSGMSGGIAKMLGEGYIPAISESNSSYGVYGADWRSTGLGGAIPRSMPMVRPMAGLGETGDVWDQAWQYAIGKITKTDFDTIKAVFDGSMAENLKRLKAEMKSQQAKVAAYKSKINGLQMQQTYDTMYRALIKFENSVLDAISWYNNGIWKIKELKAYADVLKVGGRAPEYLSGMGSLGLAPLLVAAVKPIAIAAAVIALSVSGAWVITTYLKTSVQKQIIAKADAKTLRILTEKLGSGWLDLTPIGEAGDLVKWIAIGAAVYFGAKMITESGGLKGIAETFRSKPRTA